MNHNETDCGCSTVPGQAEQSYVEPNMKDQATERMRESASSLKESVRDASSRARDMSREAAQRAQDKGRHFADERKAHLASRLTGGGEAVRRAADKLRDENDPNIARYADMIADNLNRVGQYVRERDLASMYHDVERAARRRPEIFFGGLFVAGLAVARFLKASSQNRDNRAWQGARHHDSQHEEPQEAQLHDAGNDSEQEQRPVGTPKVSMADVPERQDAPVL
jgi:hypothetical protein